MLFAQVFSLTPQQQRTPTSCLSALVCPVVLLDLFLTLSLMCFLMCVLGMEIIGAKISDCPKRGVHPHIHSHFYSVADAKRSKRRLVPVFLFWKSRLGWDFPVRY